MKTGQNAENYVRRLRAVLKENYLIQSDDEFFLWLNQPKNPLAPKKKQLIVDLLSNISLDEMHIKLSLNSRKFNSLFEDTLQRLEGLPSVMSFTRWSTFRKCRASGLVAPATEWSENSDLPLAKFLCSTKLAIEIVQIASGYKVGAIQEELVQDLVLIDPKERNALRKTKEGCICVHVYLYEEALFL